MRALAVLLLLAGGSMADEVVCNECVPLPRYTNDFQECMVQCRAKVEDADKLAADPKTPVVLATAAYLAFQELRKAALEEIKDQKHYASIGGAINKPVIWALQERLRYADRGIKRYRNKAKASKADHTVNTLYTCFIQWPDADTGPCSEEIVSKYTRGNSPMDLN